MHQDWGLGEKLSLRFRSLGVVGPQEMGCPCGETNWDMTMSENPTMISDKSWQTEKPGLP